MKAFVLLSCVLFAVTTGGLAETLSPLSLLPALPEELSIQPYPIRSLAENKGSFGWGVKGEGVDCSFGVVLHPTKDEARALYEEAVQENSEGWYSPKEGSIGDECLIIHHSPKLNITQIESLRGTTVIRMMGVISPDTAEEIVRRVDELIASSGLEPYQKVIREALPLPEPVPIKPEVPRSLYFTPPLPDVLAEFGEGLVMESCFIRRAEMRATFREPESPEDRRSPARKSMGITIRVYDTEQAAEEAASMFMPAAMSGFPKKSPYGDDGIFFRYRSTVGTTVRLRYRHGLVHVLLNSDERLEADFLDKAEKVNQFVETTSADDIAALIVKHTPQSTAREEPRQLQWGSMTNEDYLEILKNPDDDARTTAMARLAKRDLKDDAEAFGQALIAIAIDDSERRNRTRAVETLGDIGWEGAVPYLRSLIDIDSAAIAAEEESLARHMELQRLRALDALIRIEGLANHRQFLEKIANNPDESQSFREQIQMRLEIVE